MFRKRTAALLVLPLAAAGCSWFAPEEEDLDFAEYEQQLTESYNESVRLSAELDAAEARIVQECLEAQGFTLHATLELEGVPDEGERETFLDAAPFEEFLPTVEQAQRRGFWQWTQVGDPESVEDGDALAAEWEEYRAQTGQIMVTGQDLAEGDPFYDLSYEEQWDWYVAYGGEPWAEWAHPELIGVEVEEGGVRDGGDPPPVEGCRLQMLEAVYGELDEGDDGTSIRPEQPFGDWILMNERYAEDTADAEGALLDCLEGRGMPGWEFFDGKLLVYEYLFSAGEGDSPIHSYSDAGTPWPDPPSDVPGPDDVQGWLDFERALAVDFAECGDESGYRGAAVHAWQQAQLRYYLEIEDEVFAWHEEMRELITKAQNVIEG
ncbi:hypothetical protein [Glycomyces terrestris]|uniref:Uncharacterized protein n=1 Tax=Glycomyces terrestris TaxID=2493553 RepID=A0A426V468_9ACTN|nr:hypothetical protein [Glycomyces terrestris]RRS01704.1 hypothetical protein EIW28_02795 [Glycomyces terrestris]